MTTPPMTVQCPGCEEQATVAAQCDHCGYLGMIRRPAAVRATPRPVAWKVLTGVDTALSGMRHWLAAVLTVVAWTAAGRPILGLGVAVAVWLVAVPAVRLLVPPASADAIDEVLDTRDALRRNLLAGALAVTTTIGVLQVPGLGWWRLAMVAVLLAGAADELLEARGVVTAHRRS